MSATVQTACLTAIPGLFGFFLARTYPRRWLGDRRPLLVALALGVGTLTLYFAAAYRWSNMRDLWPGYALYWLDPRAFSLLLYNGLVRAFPLRPSPGMIPLHGRSGEMWVLLGAVLAGSSLLCGYLLGLVAPGGRKHPREPSNLG